MTLERQFVLLGARDSPGFHHEFGALAHRQAGAGLRDSRQDRPQVPWAQTEPGAHAFAQGLAAITLQQTLLKAPGVDHRGIAHGIDSRRNRAIDLAEGNLIAEQDRRLEAPAASALLVDTQTLRRQ